MTENPHHFHDKGYKRLLSFWKILQQLVEGYVDHEWTRCLDYRGSRRIDKSFISEEYEEKECDVLYRVPLLGQEKEVLLYILVEHQSTVDFSMPFRVLAYLVRVWEDVYRNSDEKSRVQKGYRFPPLFAIVLYNGETPWSAALEMKEVVDQARSFADYVPNVRYHLVDISTLDSERLRRMENCLAGVFLLEKEVQGEVFEAAYRQALELIYRETDQELLKAVINWVLKQLRRNFPEKTEELVEDIDWTKYNPQEAKSMLETMPQKLIAYGEQIGEQRGKQIGEQRGKQIGEQRGKQIGILKMLQWVAPELAQKYEPEIKAAQTREQLSEIEDKIRRELTGEKES